MPCDGARGRSVHPANHFSRDYFLCSHTLKGLIFAHMKEQQLPLCTLEGGEERKSVEAGSPPSYLGCSLSLARSHACNMAPVVSAHFLG